MELTCVSGYWMPFRCAKAVCATFCYEIAGALIPLFGPEFPMECIPATYPEFGEMIINQQLVAEATMEAEASRNAYRSKRFTTQNVPLMYVRHDHHRAVRSEEIHPYLRPAGSSAWTPIQRPNPGVRAVMRHELSSHHGSATPRTYPYSGPASIPPVGLRQDEALAQDPNFYWGLSYKARVDVPAPVSMPYDRERGYAGGSPLASRQNIAPLSSPPARDGAVATCTGREGNRAANGLVADYAAAATLVRLQTEEHELPQPTDGPAPVVSVAVPTYGWALRPGRANSC